MRLQDNKKKPAGKKGKGTISTGKGVGGMLDELGDETYDVADDYDFM